MKGKSKAEAKAELEKSGMSGAELEKILPHKVTATSTSFSCCSTTDYSRLDRVLPEVFQ